jgi:hypothetical protein
MSVERDERDATDGDGGDGGSRRATENELAWFQQEVERLNGSGDAALGRRDANERTRFCVWAGQNEDGRKHRDDLGRAAHPFEGASDVRVRLADFVTNVKSAVLVAAGLRAHSRVTGMELSDEGLAGRLRTLLNWLLRNGLGRSWWLELNRLCQSMVGDSPAVGVLGVFWEQKTGLRSREIGAEEFEALLPEVFDTDAERARELMETQILNEAAEGQAAEFVRGLIPTMEDKRARRILRAWRKGEKAQFPEPYVRSNKLRVMALRLWRDVWWPVNTGELKRARVIFHREWLSRHELESRRISHKYAPAFVAKLTGEAPGETGFEAQTALPHNGAAVSAAAAESGWAYEADDDFQGMYEVITAYWKTTREDGGTGVYRLAFSGAAAMAATDRELLDYAHGEYPFVEFPREVVSGRLMDSRGAPELTMTDQRQVKILDDVFSDHAQMTFPPLFVPENRPDGKLELGPMAQIKRRRAGDYEWMKLPEYPRTTGEQRAEVRRRVYEYWGIPHADVPALLTDLLQQHAVDGLLWGLGDAFKMMLQLALQYMTEEQLSRVTGGAEFDMGRAPDELEGFFDVFLDFDVRTLDPEYVLRLAETLSKTVLMWDTSQTVQRDKLTAVILGAINPNLADETLRPVEEADQSEIEAEQLNFAKIYAGVEPAMMEDGQNFGLRLKTLEEIAQDNPDALRGLAPKSAEILRARVEHLRFMVQQQDNAQTGRVGARPALDGEQGSTEAA